MHRLSFPTLVGRSWVILAVLVVLASGIALTSLWAAEPDGEAQGEPRVASSEESDDEEQGEPYPWLVLPSSIDERFGLGLEEFQEEFQAKARCFEHEAGYVLCMYQHNSCILGCHPRGFLIGTRQALYHVRSVPTRRDINLEVFDPYGPRIPEDSYCGFYDTPMERHQVPPALEPPRIAPEESPLLDQDTFLKFPSRICPEENDGVEPQVELFCGAVLSFSPLSEESSQELMEEAELHWPYPRFGFYGGAMDNGELFVAITVNSAAQTYTRVYYGFPPDLSYAGPVENASDGKRLPDGRTFLLLDEVGLPLNPSLRVSEKSPREPLTPPAQLTPTAKDQAVWRQIFREEVTEPDFPLTVTGLRPGPCELLESGEISP